MVLAEAYSLLRSKWPHRTFMIGLSVWHHAPGHVTPEHCEAEWSIYDPDSRRHFTGATLDGAMDQILAPAPALALVERQIAHFPAEAADAQDRDIESRIARGREER